MDVGLSLWLPDGELGRVPRVKEQREMVDTDARGRGGPLRDARAAAVVAPDHGRATCRRGPACGARRRPRLYAVGLDLRFDAVTPAIGTDGQPSGGPKSAEAAARRRHGRQGALRAGRRLDGRARRSTARRHEWHGALGNRDRSWGPRRWGGPTMWRWFSINVDEDLHFGGIRLGTDDGDLHRGWVWDDGTGHQRRRVARAHRAGRRRAHPAGGPPRRGRQGGAASTRCAATCCGWPTSAGPGAPWSTRG